MCALTLRLTQIISFLPPIQIPGYTMIVTPLIHGLRVLKSSWRPDFFQYRIRIVSGFMPKRDLSEKYTLLDFPLPNYCVRNQ